MATTTVRVMTWNVWWRFGPDWRARQPLLLDAVRGSGADLVVLQESWGTERSTQAQEFAAALGFSSAFAAPSLPPVPDPPEHDEQVGVEVGLGVLSRWPILSSRPVALPSRYRDPAPVAAVVTVAHPSGPFHLVAACIEWEPAYQADRIAQAHSVVDLVTDPALDGDAPVLLAGDLNAPPGGPVLDVLLDALTDAFVSGGGDPAEPTLRGDHPFAPLEAEELIDRRIDHVLYRPGRPTARVSARAARTLGDPVDGVDPSDHRAVVCDLAWDGG